MTLVTIICGTFVYAFMSGMLTLIEVTKLKMEWEGPLDRRDKISLIIFGIFVALFGVAIRAVEGLWEMLVSSLKKDNE